MTADSRPQFLVISFVIFSDDASVTLGQEAAQYDPFQQANHLQDTVYGKTFDICYAIEENDWNGNVTLQLNIKDIKPATV